MGWEGRRRRPDGTYAPASIPDARKAQIAAFFGVSVPWLMGWENGGNGNGNGIELSEAS
jgi:hypothetical protein